MLVNFIRPNHNFVYLGNQITLWFDVIKLKTLFSLATIIYSAYHLWICCAQTRTVVTLATKLLNISKLVKIPEILQIFI